MTPDISVVMGVYNGAGQLADTIESVIAQRGVDFELIIVDDGSTDATPLIAECYAARDDRVRVVHLRRVGLTRALLTGCAIARGDFIARQDCGDRSAPDRLAVQHAMFAERLDVVLATVGARFIGPGEELLYEVAQTTEAFSSGLAGACAEAVRGPSHHGATMFRRKAYEAVGGYRTEFAVAQDLDLWMRLSEQGACVATPEILYEATLSAGAISHLRRDEQLVATRMIVECAMSCRAGESDAPLLAAWRERACAQDRDKSVVAQSGFYYFLGGVLRRRDPARARKYYLEAIRQSFWQPKTWIWLALTSMYALVGPRSKPLAKS